METQDADKARQSAEDSKAASREAIDAALKAIKQSATSKDKARSAAADAVERTVKAWEAAKAAATGAAIENVDKACTKVLEEMSSVSNIAKNFAPGSTTVGERSMTKAIKGFLAEVTRAFEAAKLEADRAAKTTALEVSEAQAKQAQAAAIQRGAKDAELASLNEAVSVAFAAREAGVNPEAGTVLGAVKAATAAANSVVQASPFVWKN